MPLKNKEKRNKYQRELMRQRRSQAKSAQALADGDYPKFRMQEAEDLRKVVESAIELLQRDQDIDSVVKARAIFQGAQVAIKLLELTDLAQRVKELEAAAKEKQEGSWKDSQF